MTLPLQITFRNIEQSDLIEEWVRAEAAKLDTFYNRIMGCRVALELPHRHHRRGSRYHIRIDLTVPKEEIVVKRGPSLSHRAAQSGKRMFKRHLEIETPHMNLRQAIHDAFKAAGRQLQDYARRQRGEIKRPAPVHMGRVSKIFEDKGYGVLTSDDGREIYFHANSVLNQAFPRLKLGTQVRFAEEPGEEGPQASTVRILKSRKTLMTPKQAAAAAG
jgi:cold shock CspA family protein